MRLRFPNWTRFRSCTRLNPLLRLDLGEEASRDDGNHPDPDVRRKEVRRAVNHDVEPPVAAQPSEEAFHHPPDPAGRKCPSRVPPGETETWMSCASAAVANGTPVKPLSPSRSPWKPSAASRGSIGRVPARSSVLAGPSSRSNSEPCLSQMANTFTPLI